MAKSLLQIITWSQCTKLKREKKPHNTKHNKLLKALYKGRTIESTIRKQSSRMKRGIFFLGACRNRVDGKKEVVASNKFFYKKKTSTIIDSLCELEMIC
jgi:hypothetical protein